MHLVCNLFRISNKFYVFIFTIEEYKYIIILSLCKGRVYMFYYKHGNRLHVFDFLRRRYIESIGSEYTDKQLHIE